MKPIIWLILSIVWFAIGFTETENVLSYLGKPLGAIFFGIFWIAYFLRNAVRQYDAEQRAKIAALPADSRRRALEEELNRPQRPGTAAQGPIPNIT